MSAVGVIGLGIMGGAMCRHLIGAGFEVHGSDVDAAARQQAASAGAHIAASVEDLCAGNRPLLLSLASSQAALAVSETISATTRNRIVIDTSTLPLADKHRMADLLARSGNILLDCPISGTGAQMAAGDAVVYASGDAAALAQVRTMLESIFRQVIALGAFGNGTRMKLIANHLVAIHNVATAEAVMLGMKAGIDPDALLPAIEAGAGQSCIFSLRGPMVAADTFEPATMKLDIWAKDMAAISDFAQELGAATPMLDAVAPLYQRALDAGYGALDTAAVARVLSAPPPTSQSNETERDT
jgi:putative dehydrogenase